MIFRRSGANSSTRSLMARVPNSTSGRRLRPEGGGVGDLIPGLGQLHQHAEPRRPLGQPLRQFGGEEVGRLLRRLLGSQELGPGFGAEAEPAEPALAGRVRELERGDGEVRLPGEARRDWLRGLDESLRRRVGGQERHDGRRSRAARPARSRRSEKFQELLPGPDRKPVERMGDDVRVDVFGQVEPDGHPLRAGPHRVVVGDARNPRRQREPHGDRGGRPSGVRARVSFAASGEGVNVPEYITPLA